MKIPQSQKPQQHDTLEHLSEDHLYDMPQEPGLNSMFNRRCIDFIEEHRTPILLTTAALFFLLIIFYFAVTNIPTPDVMPATAIVSQLPEELQDDDAPVQEQPYLTLFKKIQTRDDLSNHPLSGQHVHPIAKVSHATVGVPKAGTMFNFTKVCADEFRTYEQHLRDLFKPYNDTNCKHQLFGSKQQAHVLCGNFLNRSQALVNLGFRNQDHFGCQLSKQMPNYLYHCSKNYDPTFCDHPQKTFFQRKCFGQQSQKIQDYTFITLQSQLQSNKLQSKQLILKIQLQGSQWISLRYFPLKYLPQIDQLILQVHLPLNIKIDQPYWGNIDIIKTLKQHFISVHLHLNNAYRINVYNIRIEKRIFFSTVFEVTLVNKKIITVNSEDRSWKKKVKNPREDTDEDDLQQYGA